MNIFKFFNRPKRVVNDTGSILWLAKFTNVEYKLHCKNGPAIVDPSGRQTYYLNGGYVNPEESIKDPVFRKKYPKLVKSMEEYLSIRSVHNS